MLERSFEIFQLTEDVARAIIAEKVQPHRHDYEEMLIISQGSVNHYIDFQKEKVSSPVLIYVARGKVHEFMPEPEARGWCIRYQNELIPESNFHFYSRFSDSINYRLGKTFCSGMLERLCQLMLDESTKDSPNLNYIAHLLNALLIKLETEAEKDPLVDRSASKPQLIAFTNFLKILENNFRRPDGPSFYADKLNTSPRNLNLICNSVFGKSASEIIETRKLIEARQLLLNSVLTVSEIAFDLGYNETSYFIRVFRKRTGTTPAEFRSKLGS